VQFLDTQYRMHRALTEFSSMEFYGGQLKTAKSLRRDMPKGFPWPIKDYPLCFIHVDGFHESRNVWMSTENEKEAHLIVNIASMLFQQNWRNGRVTIITPYRAQRENIEDKLNSLCGGYHKQCEVIIFSAVRANDMNSIGFLKERPRVNVMLTRPKSGLIVVGNLHTLSKEILWNKWLTHVVVKNKSFVDSRVLEQNTDLNISTK
ncbi:phage head-tail adaptor family protein, partial [Reticulomyxa filosa]